MNPAAALALRKARRKTVKMEKNMPHVTNLHEDPQLSGIVFTSLQKGEILIGRKTAEPTPDIILGAIGIQKNHGKIMLKANGLFELSVVSEAAISTFINGEPLTVTRRRQILNHCDRISFAGCIYVFKYPKLRREINRLVEAQKEPNEQGDDQQPQMTQKEQEELAWQLIKQNGLEGVEKGRPETLVVSDYTMKEQMEDMQAVDWDMAFNEVEFGELAKQDRIQKERDEQQQKQLQE